ncbi:hypothetical protein DFH27DRAFT_301581 [Peziza echinospora]|nr:hypothetical protein DFH27DRAFT_301581 [Peziza echinospora]
MCSPVSLVSCCIVSCHVVLCAFPSSFEGRRGLSQLSSCPRSPHSLRSRREKFLYITIAIAIIAALVIYMDRPTGRPSDQQRKVIREKPCGIPDRKSQSRRGPGSTCCILWGSNTSTS